MSQPVLIIDVMNAFVRCYSAYPQMSSFGHQMGGCIGFLKSLQKLMYEIRPRRIYCAWEGGGSQRRRAIYSEYKMGRRPEKLNRFYGDDIPDTDSNRKHQMLTLLEMLKHVPVCQLYVSDCEGDDLIAYLCRSVFRNEDKVIASSDKDMYQLFDERTRMYSLHKKCVLTSDDVLAEYGVQPRNFAIAKALCGDPGDNVPGIKGIGFKTVAKKFPVLGSDTDVLLQDIIDFSHVNSDEATIYRRVVEQADDIRRNYRLVYLDGGMVSSNQASKVDNVIAAYSPVMDRVGLMKLLIREGIGDFDLSGFAQSFTNVLASDNEVGDN